MTIPTLREAMDRLMPLIQLRIEG